MGLLLDLLTDMEAERLLAISIIKGLQKSRGTQEDLAKQVGISVRHLKGFLNRDHDISRHVAESIVCKLPLEREEKDMLRDMAIGSMELSRKIDHTIRWERRHRPIGDIVQEILVLHQSAVFAHSSTKALESYKTVLEFTRLLLSDLDPIRDPSIFVQLCLVASDIENIMGYKVSALWHAHLAYEVISSLESWEYNISKGFYAHLHASVIQAKSVAYQNINRYRESYEVLQEEACITYEDENQSRLWKGHLLRSEINTIIKMQRFSLRQVREMGDTALKNYALLDNKQPHVKILINESICRAYVQYGNYRKSAEIMENILQSPDIDNSIGPLHKSTLFGTYARLLYKNGDMEEWRHYMIKSIDIMIYSGLYDQIKNMQQEYASENKVRKLYDERMMVYKQSHGSQ